MNKLIVVTGGTKGIGRAIADKFASQGFDVAVCARNQQELDWMKQSLESQFKINVCAKSTDMAD
ncbi:MAG: SDR family NAD(P)-dependent oxidoreductase, partial [Flammeovirgaceae bacterium]|nr:SDR family NAD(P)-dependent oxidoreductase [Flammeovirgaceae bacterium]